MEPKSSSSFHQQDREVHEGVSWLWAVIAMSLKMAVMDFTYRTDGCESRQYICAEVFLILHHF